MYQSEKKENWFGFSVALSADSGTALIGAPADLNEGGEGAVYAFSRSGETWTRQVGALLLSEEGEFMGVSLALSSNGETALVGAPNGGTGFVYTFQQAPETPVPHWYGDGARIEKPGEWQRVDLSGTITMDLSTGPEITCNMTGEQWVKNPASGAIGLALTRGLSSSSCQATLTLCPQSSKLALTTPQVEREEKGFEEWTSQLLAGSPIRELYPARKFTILCKKGKATAEILELDGDLTPQVANSALEFGAGSGELKSAHGQTATITGTIDLTGPKGEKTITANAP